MKSLDKKKTKKLDWYSKFNEIWEDSIIISNYQIVIDQKKPDEVKSFISSLLDKQKEQILNLECLKEQNFLLEMSKLRVVIDNEHWNYARKFLKDTIEVRNQLRNEIKEEIKKL